MGVGRKMPDIWARGEPMPMLHHRIPHREGLDEADMPLLALAESRALALPVAPFPLFPLEGTHFLQKVQPVFLGVVLPAAAFIHPPIALNQAVCVREILHKNGVPCF